MESRDDMTKNELEALNSELLDLLIAIRDQIDDKLEEIAALAEEDDGEAEDSEDED